ncbi:hypothetical protein BC629DRAFT_1597513 [Irpex lacteus]|nr:hypothetical protein BC629DRAFT_1597513 [Irpex lacteus]
MEDKTIEALALEDLSWIFNTCYVFAAGTICVLWDYVLTVGDEIDFFWRPGSHSFTSVLFLCSRYATILGSVLNLVTTSGSLPNTEEVRLSRFSNYSPLTLPSFADSRQYLHFRWTIVATKVLALWKHRKYTAKLLRAIFALTYGCMFVMTILCVKYLMDNATALPTPPVCIIPHKSNLALGIWISLLTFNVFTILLIASSALETPYRRSQDVMNRLRRDGCLSLLVLTATCTLNIIMEGVALDAQHSYVFLLVVFLFLALYT